jgi:hypothetical protein
MNHHMAQDWDGICPNPNCPERVRKPLPKGLDILKPYLPWLEELTNEMNKRYGDGKDFMSVERVLEETITEWIYDSRKFMEMAGPLPIVYKDGKRYYRDDRLKEFRNVDDFTDSIQFFNS